MKLKFILICLLFKFIYAGGCSSLQSYYASMKTYINQCKVIGQMPSCFGEPNEAGTPVTTATIAVCQGLWSTVQSTGLMLANSPFSPSDNLCTYTSEQLNAEWLPYQGVLNNNVSFGLFNPCQDPNPQLLLVNKIVFANLCSF